MPKSKAKAHPHEKLGLSFAEFGALLGTREMLKSGALTFAKGQSCPVAGKHLFNMSVASETRECGSVGCIGGTMGQIMGMEPYMAEQFVYKQMRGEPDARPKLTKLFFGPEKLDLETVTVKQAIKAIDNFIKTGDPKWAKVVRKDQLK